MSNSAAWLISRGSKLSVKPAPTPVVGEYDVIIRSRAVAINPFDSLVQRAEADVVAEFPKILGHDVAGEVVAVGAKAGHKIGDRVLAFADGCLNVPKYGGFQKLVTADHLSVCRIPDLLSFVDASVIPLGLATAAVGLFRSDLLGLDLPKSSGGQIFAPKNGKSVLVWGGASSVGSNAVQLAAAAGYKVVSTASPKNFEVVRALGADAVFDYKSDTAVRDIVQELDGSEFAGAYCAVAGVLGAASEIVKQTGGRQFVASAPYLPMELLVRYRDKMGEHPNWREVAGGRPGA